MTRPKLLPWLAFFVNFFGPTFPAKIDERKCPVSGLYGKCESSSGTFLCRDELHTEKCLNVANTDLMTLNSSMWNRNVSQIYAYRNKIEVFDIEYPEILTHIDISHNALKLLPVDIFSKANDLIYLNVAHNNLQIKSLDSLKRKTLLKILDLSYNDLAVLPDQSLSDLNELERLFLKGNRLSTLPKNIFENCTKLERLNLASNAIDTLIEGTFNKLDNLTRLDLSNNHLKQLPFLGHMPNLHFLDVSMNNLVIVEIQQLPRLSIFILKNNELPSLELSTFPTGVQKTRKVDLRFNRFSSVNVTVLLEFEDTKVNNVLLDGNPWVCDATICPLVQRFPQARVFFRGDPMCVGPREMEGKLLDEEEEFRRVCRDQSEQEIGLNYNLDVTTDDESLFSTLQTVSTDQVLDTDTHSTTYSTREVSVSDPSSYPSLREESTLLYPYTVTINTTDDESSSAPSTSEAVSTDQSVDADTSSTTYSFSAVSVSDPSSYPSLREESTLLYPYTVMINTTDDESSSAPSTSEAVSTDQSLDADTSFTTHSFSEVSVSDPSSYSSLREKSTPHTVSKSTTEVDYIEYDEPVS